MLDVLSVILMSLFDLGAMVAAEIKGTCSNPCSDPLDVFRQHRVDQVLHTFR